MSRKTVLPLLILSLLLGFGCDFAEAGMPFFGRKKNKNIETGAAKDSKARGGPFPGSGSVDDLTPEGKVRSYKPEQFQQFYGAAGNRYIEYGLFKMMSADYTYGPSQGRVNIEIATMESAIAAAGLFHHHRGKVLREPGEEVDVGAEGILDVGREGRNLYFYRANSFVKVVYSGKGDVPSLLPIAEYVDARLPAGRDDKPEGLEYIEIEGVNPDTVAITHGFTFNLSLFPPSVWASAPDGGSPASDLFIITRVLDRDAEELYRDYTGYLKLYAKYIEEYKIGDLKLTKAVDPNQGRVVFASYRNALIIAARPDGYEKGEVLIERVMDRIDEVKGGGKRQKGEGGKSGGRKGLFRRKR